MARVAIITALALAICVSFLVCAAEARKKDKSKWMDKKSYFKSLSVKSDVDINKKEGKSYPPEMTDNIIGTGGSESGRKLFKKKWYRRKHGRHAKKSRSKKGKMSRRRKADKIAKHAPWSDYVRPEKECKSYCNKHEVCILGPMEMKPHCIHYKNLKKSMKKFRRFKKKELKAWRKFHKKSQKYFEKKNVFHYQEVGKFDKTAHEKAKLDVGKELMMKKKMLSKADIRKEGGKFDKTAHEKAKLDVRKELMMKKKMLSKADIGKDFAAFAFAPLEAGAPKDEMKPKVKEQSECSSNDFSQMRTRIMGWFHLLRSHNKLAIREEKRLKAHRHSVKKQMEAGEKCECMKSAMWEFHQLDEDDDDFLTDKEMAVLESNEMEPCMMPYLRSCDLDADGSLSSGEWCCCFSNVLGPCYRKMDEIRRSGEPVTYMPRCDKEGYYMAEQCQRVGDDNVECWCVDFNGNVAEGSKTNGRAHCSEKE